MILYYFKIAWRNLWKTKGHSIINVFGLAVAFTCCLIIFQFVVLEKSTDNFHEKANQLYRLNAHIVAPSQGDGGLDEVMVHIGPGYAPLFAEQVPEVSGAARIMPDFLQEGPTINYDDGNDIRVFKNDKSFLC